VELFARLHVQRSNEKFALRRKQSLIQIKPLSSSLVYQLVVKFCVTESD
jgi:hypothetical protein